MNRDSEIETWSDRIEKLVINAIYCGISFALVKVFADDIHAWERAKSIPDDWVLVAAALPFIWFGFLACWHAIVAILWPILLLFGIVGVGVAVESAKTVGGVVREIDERGGLRSIVHRLWYGKPGPPD